MTELEQQDPPAQILVYVCPTRGCGNYYGDQTFRKDRTPDIDVVKSRRVEDGRRITTHSRVECPDCRANGKRVDRVPYLVTSVMPLDAVVKKYVETRTQDRGKINGQTPLKGGRTA